MLNHKSALDGVFHALADPTRRAIVQQLARGQASVSEVAKPLGITLSAVVQHIQVLEQCGVIRTRKEGRVRTCRVEPKALALVEQWVAARRGSWEEHFDRLGAMFEEEIKAKDRK